MLFVVWRGWIQFGWYLFFLNFGVNSFVGRVVLGFGNSQLFFFGFRFIIFYIVVLGLWGSRQGSRSVVGSYGSWRECLVYGSGQGCGDRLLVFRESFRVCGSSIIFVGQDRYGDIRCLMQVGLQFWLQQSYFRDINYYCFSFLVQEVLGIQEGVQLVFQFYFFVISIKEGECIFFFKFFEGFLKLFWKLSCLGWICLRGGSLVFRGGLLQGKGFRGDFV